MALTENQKTDVRRHLGYPVIGAPVPNAQAGTLMNAGNGYRFTESYQQLEYRLANLAPAEEAALTGAGLGSVLCVGQPPAAGNTLTATFSGGGLGSPVAVVVTASAGDSLINMAMKLLVAALTTPALAAIGLSGFAMKDSPEACFVLSTGAFTLAVTSVSATGFAGALVNNGQRVRPYATVDSRANTVVYGYLGILNYLEAAMTGSTENLDFIKAETYVARFTELEDRERLYQMWVQKLVRFLGIPAVGGGSGAITMAVM